MERKKRGERRGEREREKDEESMREIDRWVRERLLQRERGGRGAIERKR